MIKKSTLIFLVCLLISTLGFSQTQIVNLGFENWDNAGTQDQEPQGWNSFRTAGGSFASFVNSQKIERSTDKRPGSAGSYSARIWATSAFGGVIANGTMTTGQIQAGGTSASDPANHNRTIRSNASFNQPFTGQPDSLVVWAKVNTASPAEEARISATIHDNYDYRDPEASDANAPAHVVAKASKNFNTAGTWQRISIPFDYNYPASSSMYVLITVTTSKTPGGGSANDEVFIDDLQFIYNPVVTIAPSANQTIVENQTGTTLTVSENFTPSSRTWKYSNTSGGGYIPFAVPQNGASYSPQFATAGIYYVVCESVLNGTSVRSNQVKITVNPFSNAISPTSTQTIFQNQQGIALNVTESPTASSREWKYSSTQGGPYQSFASPEISLNYTPLFFNIDTYYVVCQSTIGTANVVSNEVVINVLQSSTPSISITPSGNQVLEINQNGTTLTANETITPTMHEWKFSTTAGGPYTSFSPIENSNTLTPNFDQVGNYFVVCESEMNGTMYTSNEVEITVLDINVSISPDSVQHLVAFFAGDTLFATETQVPDSREWKFNTQLGAPWQSFPMMQTDNFVVPLFTLAGYYYIICESTFNGIVKTSNMVTCIVSAGPNVRIFPFNEQTIEQNQNGTTLEVDAGDFTIESQEWKFSDSALGTYNSFSVPETANNYTPLFADTGVYYVRCETVINGQTFASNEVKITVTEKSTVPVRDMKKPDFSVYSNSSQIMVDLRSKDMTNAQFSLFNIQGQLLQTNTLKSKILNVLDCEFNEKLVFYSISYKKQVFTGKLYMK